MLSNLSGDRVHLPDCEIPSCLCDCPQDRHTRTDLGIHTLHGLYSQSEEHFSDKFSHAMSSLMTSELTASPDEVPAAARCLKLVKRYGDVTAVNGLDLEVRAESALGCSGRMVRVRQPRWRFSKV